MDSSPSRAWLVLTGLALGSALIGAQGPNVQTLSLGQEVKLASVAAGPSAAYDSKSVQRDITGSIGTRVATFLGRVPAQATSAEEFRRLLQDRYDGTRPDYKEFKSGC